MNVIIKMIEISEISDEQNLSQSDYVREVLASAYL